MQETTASGTMLCHGLDVMCVYGQVSAAWLARQQGLGRSISRPTVTLWVCFTQPQGLSEACLRQTWQAVTNNIKESLKGGRGYKIPGLCTILPGVSAAPAAVLLSDQLLTAAPHLQPGKGCIHHASVKQQTQRVDVLNVAKLAHG